MFENRQTVKSQIRRRLRKAASDLELHCLSLCQSETWAGSELNFKNERTYTV